MDTIDGATFDELRETAGVEFVTELVDTFFAEAPQMLADLRRARDTADADRFRRAAHSLKSNGATFGAQELASMAKALELGGLAADPARDIEAIAALDAAYARAASALKEMCRG
jgi:HPt (histidine-containing phosphotransfer) domain-containing protein